MSKQPFIFGIILLMGTVGATQLLVQTEPAVATSADTYLDYLSAEFSTALGDKTQAYRSYERILGRSDGIEAKRGYIRLLFADGKLEKLAQETNIFEGDKETQLIFVQAYLGTGRTQQAKELLSKLVNAYPKDEQVHYFAAMFYLRSGQNQEALQSIEDFLAGAEQGPRLAIFHFLKSKILLSLGKKEEALVAAKKSVELYPKFEKGLLFSGMLAEQLGNAQEAIQGYRRFLDVVGSDAMVEKQLINLLFTQKRFSEAKDELRRLATDTPEYYFDVALLEWKMGETTAAMRSVNRVLAKQATFAPARLLKIELLLALHKQDQALRLLKSWIVEAPRESLPLYTLLLLRRVGVEPQVLVGALEEVRKRLPKNKRVLAALADLHLQQGEHDKAIALCDNVLGLVRDPMLVSQLHYCKGHVYFASGQLKESQAALLKATEQSVVYPGAYNLLAYVYATMGRKLDTALTLADQALSIAPQNPVSLDTKGFVLYKLGENDEARQVLNQALLVAPQDNIIQKHLLSVAN